MTLTYIHMYAKPNGKELYSVNIDETGHDDHKGIGIPKNHAVFFRNKSYEIKPDNILESLMLGSINTNDYEIIILEESERNK